MPKKAYESGAVEELTPLQEIGQRIWVELEKR